MSSPEDRELTQARELARHLTAFDPEARLDAALRMLTSWPVEQMVGALRGLLHQREEGDRRSREALAVLVEAISELGERDAVTDLLAYARDAHLLEISRLLERPPPARVFRPAQELGVDRQMREMPLGVRKGLARTASRQDLLRLLADPDPSVIARLLAHPKLVEADVVHLAGHRPARPEIQREIYRSGRWNVRRRVRRALANNPFTPTEIALKLVPLLPLTDARELAADSNLHESVRKSAGARVAEAARKQARRVAARKLEDLEPEGDA